MSQRTRRVSDLIRRELAEAIVLRVSDPRVRLATVSEVRVTPDLRRALVLVSILGDEKERNDSLEGLRHARGFLRTTLARRLRTIGYNGKRVVRLTVRSAKVVSTRMTPGNCVRHSVCMRSKSAVSE